MLQSYASLFVFALIFIGGLGFGLECGFGVSEGRHAQQQRAAQPAVSRFDLHYRLVNHLAVLFESAISVCLSVVRLRGKLTYPGSARPSQCPFSLNKPWYCF